MRGSSLDHRYAAERCGIRDLLSTRRLISATPGADLRSANPAPASGEEDPPARESAFSRLTRWLTWPASDASAMRISSLITTLNPMAETTNPARLIQSPALIATGSSALIIDRGRATFTLFACHPMFRRPSHNLPSARRTVQPEPSPRALYTTADSSVSSVIPQPNLRRQP